MYKDFVTRNNFISLAYWQRGGVMKKSIALLVSVSFLFPTLSWALDPQTAATAAASQVAVNPQDKIVAHDYRVPGVYGQQTEAAAGSSGHTFLLIQDLHCQAEVQKNIRGMLNAVMARHPEMRLVAVEGASGVIPTMELARIPALAAKRAVADYFLREGKLTGPDFLAICDRPQAEIFGAESQDLYDRSLELIQQFSSEEIRGILLELQDQWDLAKPLIYSPRLLAFDQKRQAYLRASLDLPAYQHYLRQSIQALKLSVPETPDRADLDEHLLALEKVLWDALAQNDAERRARRLQHFLDLSERLLHVSATRQDVLDFLSARQELSYAQILQELKKQAGDALLIRGEDLAALDAAAQASLEFYELAEARNHRLFSNTLKRMQERGERQAVLVTGGYHTQSIIHLIKQQGHAYVALRPTMTRPDAANNYFDLLRNPRMTTELEQMLAQAGQPAAPGTASLAVLPANPAGSIAAMNNVIQPAFRRAFDTAVNVTEAVRQRLSRTVQFGKRYVQINVAGQAYYVTIFQGGLYLSRELPDLNAATRSNLFQSSIFSLTATRILGLAIGGLGLAFLPAAVATGIFVGPAAAIAGLGLAVSLAWNGANLGEEINRRITKANVVLAAMVAGALLLPLVGGPSLADFALLLSHQPASGLSVLQGMVSSVQGVFSLLPEALRQLSPAPQTGGTFTYAMASSFGISSNVLVGPMFVSLPLMTLAMVSLHKMLNRPEESFALAGGGTLASPSGMTLDRDDVGQADSLSMATDRVQNRSPRKVWGKSLESVIEERQVEALKEKIEKEKSEDRAQRGQEHDRNNPVPGSTIIIPDENIAAMQDVLISNGLPNFESQTAIRITCKSVASMPEVTRAPLDSRQGIVHAPQGSIAELEINIMDLVFPDKTGKVPQEFVQKVLNGMNPAVAARLVQKDFKEYLARAYDENNKKWVGNLVASVALTWAKRNAPADAATLEEFLTQGILHEYSHGLVLPMPAGDLPADQAERLEKYSFPKYVRLLIEEKVLHSSVVMFKNMLKALRALRQSPPSESSRDNMMRVMALETFCDRFAMYLYENHLKNLVYREFFGPMAGSEFADYGRVDQAEAARRNGQLQGYLQNQGISLSVEGLANLEARLQAAERAHVYVAKYGDPTITPAEREFYFTLIQLLRHFDKEKTINSFSPKHVQTSEPIKIMPLVSSAQVGVGQTVYEEVQNHPGAPTGLAVAAGKAATGQNIFEVSLGTTEPGIPEPVIAEDTPEELASFAEFLSEGESDPTFSENTAVVPPTNLLANASLGLEDEEPVDALSPLEDFGQFLAAATQVTEAVDMDAFQDEEALNLRGMGIAVGDVMTASQAAAPVADLPADPGAVGNQVMPGRGLDMAPAPPLPPLAMLGDAAYNLGAIAAYLTADWQRGDPAANAMFEYGQVRYLANLGLDLMRAGQAKPQFGFDSKSLAQAFENHLQSMSQYDARYAELYRQSEIRDFSAQSPPADWRGITVLSQPVSETKPLTFIFNRSGESRVVVERLAIPLDVARGSLTSAQLDELARQGGVIAKDVLLIDRLEKSRLSSATQDALSALRHVQVLVEGYELIDAQNELAGAADSLRSRLAANFEQQPQRTEIRVTVNRSELERTVRARGSVVVRFNPVEQVVTAANVGAHANLGAGFLQAQASGRYVESAPLSALLPEMGEAQVEETADMKAVFLADLRARIEAAMDEKETARSLSDLQLESLISELNGMAEVSVLWSDQRLLDAGRLHAKSYVQAGEWMAKRRPVYRPLLALEHQSTEVKSTEYMKLTGRKKFFSSLLLGVVAGVLVFRSTDEIVRQSKGHRLQLLNYLRYPTFLKALRIMILIVQGRVDKALQQMPSAIKVQVAEIQRLATDVDTLKAGEAPDALRYALKAFQDLIKQVLGNRLFRWLARLLGMGEKDLVDLYPEIFMLLSQSEELRGIVYYVSPAFALRYQIQYLQGMDPSLQQAMTMDLASARALLADLKSRQAPALDKRIADLQFAVAMNASLDRLNLENNTYNIRQIAKLLIRQLGRKDIDDSRRQDILKLLSMITPFHQVPLKIRLASGQILETGLPEMVVYSLLRNQMIEFLDVFDMQNQPLPMVPRPMRFSGMA